MNTYLFDIIKRIIAEHGESILSNPQKLKPLFADYAKAESKMDRVAFGRAIENGFYMELKHASPANRANVKTALVSRLQTITRFDIGCCTSAVDMLEAAISPSSQTEPQKTLHCVNCGTQLSCGAKFCAECAAPVSSPQQPSKRHCPPPPPTVLPKKKKKAVRYVLIAVAGLIAIVGTVWFLREWNRHTPSQIGKATNWAFVSASSGVGRYTVAIKTDGTLWAWGGNWDGVLGDGTTISREVPVQIGAATNWASVTASGTHTVAIRTDGTLWAWGRNWHGELGDGTTITLRINPTQIGTATSWASVSAGHGRTVAIRTDGTLWAWGRNWYGELGDGTTITPRINPTQIGTATNWTYVSAGSMHTVAMRTDGTLWAWGNNSRGQLGDDTITHRNTPVQIGTYTDWAYVSAGSEHTIAIKTDGSLWAWGSNSRGQLGDGTTIDRSTPVRIGTATNWAYVSAGQSHTMAIRTDGTLWAWGCNSHGELGDRTTTSRNTPVQIGTDTDWVSITAGGLHTAAIRRNGTLWAWGWGNR